MSRMDLRARRRKAGISQRQLAELTGYDPSYISKVERGQAASADFIRRCKAALRDRPAVVNLADDSQPVANNPLPYKDFGAELRRLRVAQGLTLRELADRVMCHRGTLGNIEVGNRRPSASLARLCDKQLEANGQLVALLDTGPPDTTAQDVSEVLLIGVNVNGPGWLVPVSRRAALEVGVALGAVSYFGEPMRHVDDDPDRLTSLFEQIRGLSQQVNPHLTLPLLISKAHGIRQTAMAGSSRKRPALWTLATHFAIYTGKMFQEAGDVSSASRWTADARDWATESGDPGLVAYVLTRQAMLTFYGGPPEDVVGLARKAQRITAAPSRIRGLAALREALGHARAGDDAQCRRCLDRAAGLLTGQDGLPRHLAALEGTNVTDHVAITTAFCEYDLGYPHRAAALLDQQVATVPPQARRTLAQFSMRRALAHAAAGDITGACTLTWQLLPDIQNTASATSQIDMRELTRTLNRKQHHAGVRELLSEINSLRATMTRKLA